MHSLRTPRLTSSRSALSACFPRIADAAFTLLATAGIGLLACAPKASVAPVPMTPGAPMNGAGAGSPAVGAAQPYGAQPYPAQQYPSQPNAAQPYPAQPYAPQPYSAGVGANTPLSDLHTATTRLVSELIGNLRPEHQQRVASLPFVFDPTPGEVNAYAGCDEKGHGATVVTDSLLQVNANLATAQAHDEIFGTQTVAAYIQQCASGLRPNQAVPNPPASLFPGFADPRVAQRQGQIFEEAVGWVLGHEFGHHYLGHLPCTAGPETTGAGEAVRILAGAAPIFTQPLEVAADMAGIHNVLTSGKNRAARGQYAWTEGGALLTLRFFSGFDELTPEGLILSFEHAHPLPQLRMPLVQQTAATFRATGGAGIPFLGI